MSQSLKFSLFLIHNVKIESKVTGHAQRQELTPPNKYIKRKHVQIYNRKKPTGDPAIGLGRIFSSRIDMINRLNENMENLGRELEMKKMIKNKFCNLKI